MNLQHFLSTHHRCTDVAKWEHLVHTDDHTVAVHVYRDFSGSPFFVLEQHKDGHTWFEYDWNLAFGSGGKADTLDWAAELCFRNFVEREVA